MSDTAHEVKAILRRTLRDLDEAIDNRNVSSLISGLGSLLGLDDDTNGANASPPPRVSAPKKGTGKAGTPASRSPSKPAAKARKATRKAATGERREAARTAGAPKSSRRDDLLALIRKQPGVTLAQAAKRFGLKDSTSLYSIARRLQQEGLVVKDGAQFRPAPKSGTAKRS